VEKGLGGEEGRMSRRSVQGAATKTKFGDDLLENDIDYLGYLTTLFYSQRLCGVE
jgi:hypothetical protein